MAACRPTARRRTTCRRSWPTRTSIAARAPRRPPCRPRARPVPCPTRLRERAMTHRTAPPQRVPSAGPPPPQSAPGVSGDQFAAILDQHQARTATAEGRTPEDKASTRTEERDSRREAHDVESPRKRPDDDPARGTEAAPQEAAPVTEAVISPRTTAGKDAPVVQGAPAAAEPAAPPAGSSRLAAGKPEPVASP